MEPGWACQRRRAGEWGADVSGRGGGVEGVGGEGVVVGGWSEGLGGGGVDESKGRGVEWMV